MLDGIALAGLGDDPFDIMLLKHWMIDRAYVYIYYIVVNIKYWNMLISCSYI